MSLRSLYLLKKQQAILRKDVSYLQSFVYMASSKHTEGGTSAE